MYNEGSIWYAAARETVEKLGQDTTDLLLRTAGHWLDAAQPDKAVSAMIALTGRPRAPAEAWLLLSSAYEMLNKPDEARRAAAEAIKVFSPATTTRAATAATLPATASAAAATTAPASQPVPLEARIQADWISLMYLDEVGSSLQDARTAFETNTDPLWARRTYGWALLRAKQADQAIRVFKPAVEIDPWSALGLAQALYDRGDKQAASDALRSLQRLSPTGPAWWAARRWSKEVGLALPTPEASQVGEAQTLLAGFNKALLRLPLEPGRFLEVKVEMDAPPAAGEPWFGRIHLTNIGDQPIYCGPDGALMPNVLLSAMVYDPAARDIGQRLLLSLYRQMVLAPKQTITLYRPLDTGPLREVLRDPYRDISVAFIAILDPVRTEGGAWQPGPDGLVAEPVIIARPAGAPAGAEDLLRLARSGSQDQKIGVARQIACITVGLAGRAPAQTQPAAPPAAVLTQAFTALLQDGDPIVAAHALAQADHIPLSDALAQAAAPQVGNSNWLDKLMAIRLFAHKQGAKFVRALGGLAAGDPDTLVRQLAAAYHAAFQGTAGK